MRECERVLKTGGSFISISFTGPLTRLIHLERDFIDFDMRIHEIFKQHYMQEITNHYIYIMRKQNIISDQIKELNWKKFQ